MIYFISKNSLKPSAVNREIYINMDFLYPEANVTEIQIGINWLWKYSYLQRL